MAEEALRKIEEAKAKAAADAIAAEEAAKKAKTAELEKFWKAVSILFYLLAFAAKIKMFLININTIGRFR